MRSFPSSKLNCALGDVLDAASQEPVAITRHGAVRFVLMSIHGYESRFSKGERQTFATEDMPVAHLAKRESALPGLAEDGRT
ncbi:type II toxin-antitoxin system Phd/YefM family antitoxin [Paenirhodobacter populi]|uniref:Antitoxin n=1 Tax=Paenirhodobacter populi TaxID=2306993 RepID=A0A443JRG1_9RHOB|nr:type II toxin-antitoxin system Phd/YefM family antitoxin [Sinirhodobacter populi]RWR23087.1 type II toxin-antitoxin system Phd/YefM family antitoxin [Sinirhodobacter populi]